MLSDYTQYNYWNKYILYLFKHKIFDLEVLVDFYKYTWIAMLRNKTIV